MIHLISNYYLTGDKECFIVGVKKNGEERLRELHFYSSITEAIDSTANRIARDSIQTGEVQTFNGLCDKLRSIKEELTAAVERKCGND